jgi:two-component system, OmpR family, response regulator
MTEKYALVVDDTPANRDFLERLLTMAGFKVRSALDGETALAQYQAGDELQLAVVDMELPDMSGLQLTSILRHKFPDTYIVVATMHDERSLMESVFTKGGNAFLVKPHGFMELFKRLTTLDLVKMRDGDYVVIDQYGPRVFTLAQK